jgi:hypothetical protein
MLVTDYTIVSEGSSINTCFVSSYYLVFGYCTLVTCVGVHVLLN